MKKVYSSKLKAEVFALAPEQLKIFERAGYKTPDAAEVIADAGAAVIEPPASARAYAVFNLKSGAFSVRVRGCTIKGSETGAFVGEVVQASIIARLLENADPDKPKTADKPASPLVSAIVEAFKKAADGGAAAPAAESEEVAE